MKKEEYIMLNLRKFNGILLSDYKKKFNKDFYLEFKDTLDSFIKDNLLKKTNFRIYPTKYGMVILDYMLIKLFKEIQ